MNAQAKKAAERLRACGFTVHRLQPATWMRPFFQICKNGRVVCRDLNGRQLHECSLVAEAMAKGGA